VGQAADERHPCAAFYVVMLGALVALMSTADSQLLTLATMLAHDLMPELLQVRVVPISRALVVLVAFALSFVLFGYDPRVGIMDTLVKTTFSGLVVLFPAVFGGPPLAAGGPPSGFKWRLGIGRCGDRIGSCQPAPQVSILGVPLPPQADEGIQCENYAS